ncbi:MAG: hypothetical protein LBH00_08380 [Planctomycetaceae bacterium]|nr:hypothetical protein [Planctomycetaceae bacterium]
MKQVYALFASQRVNGPQNNFHFVTLVRRNLIEKLQQNINVVPLSCENPTIR